MCFSLHFFLNFLNSASSAAALVFYLLGVHTHWWHRGKTESGKYIKIFEKTQYLMNALYLTGNWTCKCTHTKLITVSKLFSQILDRSKQKDFCSVWHCIIHKMENWCYSFIFFILLKAQFYKIFDFFSTDINSRAFLRRTMFLEFAISPFNMRKNLKINYKIKI